MENEHIKRAGISVNISESTTELTAYIADESVYSSQLNIGTKTMDLRVTDYLKRRQGLRIGERTTEAIRTIIGSAFPEETNLAMDVRGRNLENNIPRTISVTEKQISQALSDDVDLIIGGIKMALERILRDSQEALENYGIILRGPGAGLRRLDKRIMMETKLPVIISD